MVQTLRQIQRSMIPVCERWKYVNDGEASGLYAQLDPWQAGKTQEIMLAHARDASAGEWTC